MIPPNPDEPYFDILQSLNQIPNLNVRRVQKLILIDKLFTQYETISYQDYIDTFKEENKIYLKAEDNIVKLGNDQSIDNSPTKKHLMEMIDACCICYEEF